MANESPLRRFDPNLGTTVADDSLSAQDSRALTLPETSDVERGFRSSLSGLSAGSLASNALQAELAGDTLRGNELRDQALSMAGQAAAEAPRVQSYKQVHGVGDALDFAQAQFAQALPTMGPPIAAAAAARFGLRNPFFAPAVADVGAHVAAAVPAFQMEKDEAVLNQYQDPVQAARSADERNRVANIKGGVNAALESIVPAGLSKINVGKSVGREFAKNVGEEALTEGVQEKVGQLAQSHLNPERDTSGDAEAIINAGLGGAIGGGGVAAPHAVLHAVANRADAAAKAGVTHAQDFMRLVFPTNESTPDALDAEKLSQGDGHSSIQTPEDLDAADKARPAAAQRLAEKMLADKNTPNAVRAKLESMNGDYESSENQQYIGTQVMAQNAGARAAGVIKAVRGAFDGLKTADDGVKHNLQDVAGAQSEMLRTLLGNLKPEFDTPETRTHLTELARTLTEHAANFDALDRKAIERISDLGSLARDPKQMFNDIDAVTGATQFASRIAEVQPARTESEDPQSMLRMAVTPETRDYFARNPDAARQLGALVDDFILNQAGGKNEQKILGVLHKVFGGKEMADEVLSHYEHAHRGTLDREKTAYTATPEEGRQMMADHKADMPEGETNTGMGQVTPASAFKFKSSGAFNEPFTSETEAQKSGHKGEPVSLHQMVQETGGDVAKSAEALRERAETGAGERVNQSRPEHIAGLKERLAGAKSAEEKAALSKRIAYAQELASPNGRAKTEEMAKHAQALRTATDEQVLEQHFVMKNDSNERNNYELSDQDMRSMRRLNDSKQNPDKTKEAARKATFFEVTRTDGSKFKMSAESVAKTWAAKMRDAGEDNTDIGKMFKEGLAALRIREDIAQVAPTNDTVIDRASGLTWGQVKINSRGKTEEGDRISHEMKKELVSRERLHEDKDEGVTDIQSEIADKTPERHNPEHDLGGARGVGAPGREATKTAPKGGKTLSAEERAALDEEVGFPSRRDKADEQTQAKKKIPTPEVKEAAKPEEDAGAKGQAIARAKANMDRVESERERAAIKNESVLGMRAGKIGELTARLFSSKSDAEKARDGALKHAKQIAGKIIKVLHSVPGDVGNEIAGANAIEEKNGKSEAILFLSATNTMAARNMEAIDVANHEVAHTAVSAVIAMHGMEAAKRLVALANEPHIREQVLAFARERYGDDSYFRHNPEEAFAEAYAMWAAGELELRAKSDSVIKKVFEQIQLLMKLLTGDQALHAVFQGIKSGQLNETGLTNKDIVAALLARANEMDLLLYGTESMNKGQFEKLIKRSDERFVPLLEKMQWVQEQRAGALTGGVVQTLLALYDHYLRQGMDGEYSLDEMVNNLESYLDAAQGIDDAKNGAPVLGMKVEKKYNRMSFQMAKERGENPETHVVGVHNSPHRFDGSFDWRSHAMKGEGAMAFGAGTYISTADAVHRHYKSSFEKGTYQSPLINGKAIPDIVEVVLSDPKVDKLTSDVKRALSKQFKAEFEEDSKKLREGLETGEYGAHDYDEMREHLSMLEDAMVWLSLQKDDAEIKWPKIIPAATYHITSDIRRDELLHWDNHVSMQSPGVQAKLKSLGISNGASGEAVYRALSKKLGGDAAASEALQAAGIPGHEYGSQGGNNSQFPNYVIYDDKRIQNNFVQLSKESPVGVKLTQAEQDETVAEIERLRGKDIKVAFENLTHSGEYSNVNGERLIKIALGVGGNRFNVARHEALHDFFKMLNTGDKLVRQTFSELIDTLNKPATMRQLARLLADHPEALRDAQNDPEEAAAYAYQFWAAGQLQVGPQTRTLLGRIQAFLASMLGFMSKEQKAEALLAAFHAGRFADDSTVGHVLRDLQLETVADKIKRIAPPLHEMGQRFIKSATDQLREPGFKSMVKIADLFHQDVERQKGGLSFIDARAKQTAVFQNRLSDIIGKANNETVKQAVTAMQLQQPARTPEAQRIVDQTRVLLNDMHKYMTDAGVQVSRPGPDGKPQMGPIRFLKDYYPRAWSPARVRANRTQFIADMMAEGNMRIDQATQIFNAISKGDGQLGLAENDRHLGFTPFSQGIIDRQLNFITKDNAAVFQRYMDDDLLNTLSTYIVQGTHRAEYARTFGNEGEVIRKALEQAKTDGATDEEVGRMAKVVRGLEGTLGSDYNPTLRTIQNTLVSYQNLVLLPFALVNSLVDPMGIALRSGEWSDAWEGMKEGFRGLGAALRGKDPSEAAGLAADIGAIDKVLGANLSGELYTGPFMAKWLKNVNDKFFRWNGMSVWNDHMRIAALEAGRRFIVRHAEKAAAGDAKSKRWMKELGLEDYTPIMVNGELVVDADTSNWAHDTLFSQQLGTANKEAAKTKYLQQTQDALYKFIDGAVLRPNAAHRPTWGSDPMFQLLFHLKQFTFSFQNTILRRVTHEAEHENMLPYMMLMSYVPFTMATSTMKGALLGTLPADFSLGKAFSAGVAQSGVSGVGQFGTDAFNDAAAGRVPGQSLAGPTVQQGIEAANTLAGAKGHGLGHLLERSSPLSPLVKAIRHSADSTIVNAD